MKVLAKCQGQLEGDNPVATNVNFMSCQGQCQAFRAVNVKEAIISGLVNAKVMLSRSMAVNGLLIMSKEQY